ncbi:MAG: PEP-CTERM sorting domain-containing protein [Thermoguttaceae bacterium]|nr:PEP-CTERM sorting domain-containing protein [Thermoguttaceae bacterium]
MTNYSFRSILILTAIFVNAASIAQADTYWSDTAPASVTDLMTADYWTDGAPTSADNPGFITGKSITVTNDFKPGANGQNIDLTFGKNSSVTLNKTFVPVANIASNQNGTVTFRLTDNANVYVKGNFWGGTNDESRTYNNLGEGEYNLYQYYGGNSTFSSGEWWAGMTAKTYILISDNAVVTARSGNSGLGWGSKSPYASYGSVLELTGHGSLNSNGSNMNIWGTDTTVNMYDNSTFSANTLNVSKLTPQFNLYNKSTLTTTGAATVDNSGSITANGDSKITFGGAATVNSNGSLTANDKSALTFNGTATVNNNGALTANENSTITFKGATTVNNQGSITANGNSVLSLTNTFKLDNTASITLNGAANMTVTNEFALDRNGAMYVNGNAEISFTNPDSKRTWKIGDVNAGADGGAIYTQTGGTVTTARTSYFSYHSDATVTISGGKFISTASQLYAADLKGVTGDITISGDGYLQAKDLRLSQHGNTNLTMSGTSQISVENLNIAFNHTANDNVVSVVTMGGSSSITASQSMYFFGSNAAGAAYGSLTLNDNASIAIANDVQVGKGSTISLITGKSYAAEITLNGNSVFTTKTFTATSGAKSATSVNGSATFNADTINIQGESLFNVNGGEVNALTLTNTGTSVTSVSGTGTLNAETINIESGTTLNVKGGAVNILKLNNTGAVSLTGGEINLTPYGLITSTGGTFTATGGTINVKGSNKVSYTMGDQLLVGLFVDEATASDVAGITKGPEGWQTSYFTLGSSQAVIASYGTEAPTGVKTWIPGASGSMTDSTKWSGAVNNPTGYVLSGTNTISGITGKTFVMGGTNTFNGDMPANTALTFNGGTSSVKGTNFYGSMIVNDGTVDFTGGDRVFQDNASYLEVNGGEVKITDKWFKSYQDIVVNDGKVNFTGNGLAMKLNCTMTNNGGEVAIKRIIVGDDNISGTDPAAYTAKYINNAGKTTISGSTDIAEKASTIGYFEVNGGSVTTDVVYVAKAAETKGYLNITGDGSLQTGKQIFLGYKGNADLVMSDNASLKITNNYFYLAYNLASGDNVVANVTMSGNSRIETRDFVVFAGNKDKSHSGAAYASLTMTGNSYFYASNNTWCGHNNDVNTAALIQDKEYNLEMTFTGNSYFSTNEFWMAMSAKTHTVIDKNATVIARGGNSGIGWGTHAAGSLLEIKGGTFQVDSNWFAIGCMNETGTPNTGVCNVLQTGGQAIYKKQLLLGQNASAYKISGADAVITAGNITTLAGSTFKMEGGTVTVTTIKDAGTLDVSGGTLNAGGITINANGAIQISGGTIIPGASGITAEGAHTVNLSGGVLTTNGASWTATDITATVADNSTVTFEPENGQTIKWSGALVNSAQNAKIVKDGNGVLKIDSSDNNNPTKLGSFVVNAGELDFKGYFIGNIEVNDSAVFSPGNSIGTTYETGNFNLNPGATLLMEVEGPTIADSDQLYVTGSLNLGEGSSIVLDFVNGISPNMEFAVLIDATNSNESWVNYVDSYYFTDLSYAPNADGKWVLSGKIDPNAVPEPSTWALLAIGAAGLLYVRKRTRK